MRKFKVRFDVRNIEIETHEVEVEANTETEAANLAYDKYFEGDYGDETIVATNYYDQTFNGVTSSEEVK